MSKKTGITYIREANVHQCNDCGAHAESISAIQHHPTCKPGESKKWERFYDKANKEEFAFDANVNRDEFNICCKWLSQFEQVKIPKLNSYYLKHVVEKLEGEYVSNDALIAAAEYLKIPMEYDDSPNPAIAIAKKSVKGVIT